MVILLAVIVSAGFVSCGDDDDDKRSKSETSSIVGHWEDSHSGGIYDTYSFYDDGLGMYRKWEEIPNYGSASSDFTMVFSYTLTGETLTLDFGFGYVKKYRVQNISMEYLYMYYNNSNILCTRKQMHDRHTFPDYSMAIVGGWLINDTEKSKQYDIYFRADGSFESSTNGTIENGTYQVDKSRVKFTSNNSNSLLNGRIFLITHIANSSYGGGNIHLQTENGVSIKGTQKN
jgi:hypothetical protein